MDQTKSEDEVLEDGRSIPRSRTWAIIGLGWLGQALAADLEREGVPNWGTHRDRFDFSKDDLPTDSREVLFLNTPPLVALDPSTYVVKVERAGAGRVVFVSSTSVYGDVAGTVTETSEVRPATDSARWLRAVEVELARALGDRLSVIRPGGLIGGDRHPVYPLSRRGATVTDGPINLIHRDDLVAIVRAVAGRSDLPLVNAVSPVHPKKSDYYAAWAKKLNLPAIAFAPSPGSDRVVDSVYLPTIHSAWRCRDLDYL